MSDGREPVRAVAVITGANRGIGLEIVRELLVRTDVLDVIATSRSLDRAAELHQMVSRQPRLSAHHLDVTDPASIERFAREIDGAAPVAIVVNNAGIGFEDDTTILDVTMDEVRLQIETHALGPLHLVRLLAPRLRRGAVVAGVSSVVGGVSRISASYAAYAPAKALQNAFTRSLAGALADRGVVVLAVHPGWVSTTMGGPSAPDTPAESAAGMVRQILAATMEDSDTFRDLHGEPVAW